MTRALPRRSPSTRTASAISAGHPALRTPVFGVRAWTPAKPSRLSAGTGSAGTNPLRLLSATARTNTRSRRWGAPASDARNTAHSASNPSAAKSPRTRPNSIERSPATFSTNTMRGRTTRTMRAYSLHSPDLSPARPLRLPATDTSWHGNPPQITSTGSSSSPTAHTSSKRRASGQCFASTVRHHGSRSTCHTVRPPVAASTPRSSPPMPLNSDPMRGVTGAPGPTRSRSPTGVPRGERAHTRGR